MVSVIYKVVEVAKILGFNERTIRRDISSMSEDVRAMSVECPTDVRHMSVTEYGLKWLADKHNITLDGVSSVDEKPAEEQTEKTDCRVSKCYCYPKRKNLFLSVCLAVQKMNSF